MKPTLGILLNLGDSFLTYRQAGRDQHWLNNYLNAYLDVFSRPWVFSYAPEANPFPRHIRLLPNRWSLPRFIYTFLLPLIYRQQFRACRVLRVKQMLGVWPALLAKLFWGKPVLATYGYDYTHFAKKEGKRFSLPLIKLTEYLGLKFSDKVIVTNLNVKRRLSHLVPKDRLVLLPNGVDIDLFRPLPSAPARTIKIVSVGRLVHQKNFSSLIAAVADLHQNRPVKLTILGSGSLKGSLMSQAKQLRVNLKIIDSLPHLEVPKLLQSVDLFILPSHYEGSPKALLEAMSCGLACIVTDKAFSRFIVTHGENGWLTANDPASLTQAITTLLQQPKLTRRLGKQARQTISKRFDNRTIIKKEIKLLLNLIND